jgi:hypothetical protein
MPVLLLELTIVPQPRDGFEGMGYLAELLVAILVTVVLLFLATVFRKVHGAAHQRELARGRYLWASLVAYAVSVICGYACASLALTDDFRRTAIMVSVGTLFALASLVMAIYARGAGRILGIVSSAFLTVLWAPMFYGRVLTK